MQQLLKLNFLEITCRYACNLKKSFSTFYFISDVKLTLQIYIKKQQLERNLPMDDYYKSDNVSAAPIRVIRLLFNAGVCYTFFISHFPRGCCELVIHMTTLLQIIMCFIVIPNINIINTF
jgi:hypothetical protein